MLQASPPAVRLLVLGFLAAGSLSARGATVTDILNVSATVLSSCALSGGTLSFGNYTSGQPTDLDVDGSINYVNCSGTLTFALDGGGSGNINARQMRQGANQLNYQIYRTASRSAVFGTGADSQGKILIGTQSGTLTIYGRIPKSQIVPDGTYTDIVNITLTF
ncbi:MAG: spore coat U domain-containing protein [Geminicoccaceae bacterium]